MVNDGTVELSFTLILDGLLKRLWVQTLAKTNIFLHIIEKMMMVVVYTLQILRKENFLRILCKENDAKKSKKIFYFKILIFVTFRLKNHNFGTL